MKAFWKSINFTLVVLSVALLMGCGGSTSEKLSQNVSNCNPNLNEIFKLGETAQSSSVAEISQQANGEMFANEFNHILSVSCINDNKMLIVHYDPDFVCCLTPHSTCELNGNKIIINDWDTGGNPCDCLCPRKTDATLSEVPYGKYTFSLRYANKEKHSAVIDFTSQTDTVIVFEH